jgi:hypothetical protein
MKTKNKIWAILGVAFLLIAAKAIKENVILIGDSTAGDKELIFDIGAGTSNPRFKWNNATSSIQFTNDNVTLFDVGSGGGSGSGGINLIGNPGFETGVASDWTATGGSFSDTTNVTELINGGKSGKWDSNGTGQTLETTKQNLPNKLVGNSCSVQVSYRGDAITPGDLVLRIEDAVDADVLPLNAAGNPWLEFEPTISGVVRQAFAAFICPDTAQMQVVLESKVADAPEIVIDDVHLGSNVRAGVVDGKITAWQSFTPNWNNGGTISSQSWSYRRVGESMEIRGSTAWSGPGAGSLMTMVIPDSKSTSLPSGASTRTGQAGNGGFYDALEGGPFKSMEIYAASATTIAFAISNLNSISGNELASGDFLNTTNISIPILEWQGQGTTDTVTLETQGWHVDAEIGGSSANLSTADVGTYTEVNATGTDMILATGSAPAKISCVNAPSTGLSCGAAEGVGVNFIAPYGGNYKACFAFAHVWRPLTSSDGILSAFQIMHRNNINNLVISEGGDVASSGTTHFSAVNTVYMNSIRLCRTLHLDAGENTLALHYTSESNGAPSSNDLDLQRATGNSGRKIARITVIPLTQNSPQAVALPVDQIYIQALDADLNANTVDIPSLRHSNLVVGRTYRFHMTVSHNALASGNVNSFMACLHDGAFIGIGNFTGTQTSSQSESVTLTTILTATATSITCNWTESGASNRLLGNDTIGETHTIIEELSHSNLN